MYLTHYKPYYECISLCVWFAAECVMYASLYDEKQTYVLWISIGKIYFINKSKMDPALLVVCYKQTYF